MRAARTVCLLSLAIAALRPCGSDHVRRRGRRLHGFVGSALGAAGASLNMGGGRGVGKGRFRASRVGAGGPGAPHWRAQVAANRLTTTQQGCNLNVISLKPQNQFKEEGLSPSKALYHLGWYTGLEMVQWCHVENALGPYDEGAYRRPLTQIAVRMRLYKAG